MSTAVLTMVARLVCLFSLIRYCRAADFTGVSFDSVIEGSTLNLTWDNTGLGADAFPLIVEVSLINQTDSGVFGVKRNLSVSVDTASYQWQGLPYPAPYLPTAQYQLEVKSSRIDQAIGASPVVAKSPFFTIHQAPKRPSSPGDTNNEPAPQSSQQGGLSKNASIAIGVVVGVFSVMAFGIVAWCFRRRQRKAREERRRRKRLDFVIS